MPEQTLSCLAVFFLLVHQCLALTSHINIYPSGQSAMPRTSKAKSAWAKNANFASAFKKVKGEVLNGSRESARSSAKVAKQSSLAQATRRRLAAAGAGASSDEVDSDDSADESYSDQDASKLVNGTVVTAEERQTARQVALMSSTFLTETPTPAAMAPTTRKSPDSSRISEQSESCVSDTNSSCDSVTAVSSADSIASRCSLLFLRTQFHRALLGASEVVHARELRLLP